MTWMPGAIQQSGDDATDGVACEPDGHQDDQAETRYRSGPCPMADEEPAAQNQAEGHGGVQQERGLHCGVEGPFNPR